MYTMLYSFSLLAFLCRLNSYVSQGGTDSVEVWLEGNRGVAIKKLDMDATLKENLCQCTVTEFPVLLVAEKGQILSVTSSTCASQDAARPRRTTIHKGEERVGMAGRREDCGRSGCVLEDGELEEESGCGMLDEDVGQDMLFEDGGCDKVAGGDGGHGTVTGDDGGCGTVTGDDGGCDTMADDGGHGTVTGDDGGRGTVTGDDGGCGTVTGDDGCDTVANDYGGCGQVCPSLHLIASSYSQSDGSDDE